MVTVIFTGRSPGCSENFVDDCPDVDFVESGEVLIHGTVVFWAYFDHNLAT